MDYLHLDAGRRISHRAAGSFLRLVVLVDMRGEALNPADDFILHSAIFCLDYVSRHIWWEVKGLPANAFQNLFAGDLRVLRLSRWDAA
jgi:hypothetical protein